ncbi:MAG: DUF192 domain-containing protein [Steroidobacteraceae bacterium]
MNRKVIHVRAARTLWKRARGLILSKAPPASVALHLSPCWCIHTVFMSFPVDLVFLDAGNSVLRVVPELRPWRFSGCLGARSVLEFRAGEVERLGLRLGDSLALTNQGDHGRAAA